MGSLPSLGAGIPVFIVRRAGTEDGTHKGVVVGKENMEAAARCLAVNNPPHRGTYIHEGAIFRLPLEGTVICWNCDKKKKGPEGRSPKVPALSKVG